MVCDLLERRPGCRKSRESDCVAGVAGFEVRRETGKE